MSRPSLVLFFALVLFLSSHSRKGYSFSIRDDEIMSYPCAKVVKDHKTRVSSTSHDIWMPNESKQKLSLTARRILQEKMNTVTIKTKTKGKSWYWVKNAKDFKGGEATTVMDYAQPHEEPSVHN